MRRIETIVAAIMILGALVGYFIFQRVFYLDRMKARGGKVYVRLDESFVGMELNGEEFGNGDLRYLSTVPGIAKLYLSESQVTDYGIRYFQNLPITLLDVSGTQITDDGLKAISEIATLRFLMLNDLDITDEGVEHLSKLKELEVLHLNGCRRVTIAGLRKLSELPELELLQIQQVDISLNDFIELEEMFPELLSGLDSDTVLGLTSSDAMESRWIRNSRTIAVSRRYDVEVSDEEYPRQFLNLLVSISDKSAIEEVNADDLSDQADDVIKSLSEFVNLKRFSAMGEIQQAEVDALAEHGQLVSVFISNKASQGDGEPIDLSSFSKLKRLRSLSVYDTAIVSGSLDSLEQLEYLESVNLDQCGLTDQDISFIGSLPHLRSLSFKGNHLTRDVFQLIENCLALESCLLPENQIPKQELAEFIERLTPRFDENVLNSNVLNSTSPAP